jgi:hypothetical protein
MQTSIGLSAVYLRALFHHAIYEYSEELKRYTV